MKQKRLFFLFLMLALLVLAACSLSGGSEPAVNEADTNGNPSAEPISEEEADAVAAGNCAVASEGLYQLLYAAQGVCFLYPDNFDVMQGEDGTLTLYERSTLNTEAPFASISFEPANGRSAIDLISDYIPGFNPETGRPQMRDLGGESAVILDNLPGQDTNRRVIAVHEDRLINVMVVRVGADYGAVGEQAEALYSAITGSFQFIDIEPEAPLLAGPECPEAPVGTTLFTNVEDGFCLLLPDGYAVDDSLTTESGGAETAVYIDSPQDAAHARLFITVEDAAGQSLDEITAAKEAELEAAIPGFDAFWSFGHMLDGAPANQFDQVPGQDLSRELVLVKDGRLYTLTFIPDDAAASDAYAEMQTLYNTVLDSFSFLWQS